MRQTEVFCDHDGEKVFIRISRKSGKSYEYQYKDVTRIEVIKQDEKR